MILTVSLPPTIPVTFMFTIERCSEVRGISFESFSFFPRVLGLKVSVGSRFQEAWCRARAYCRM